MFILKHRALLSYTLIFLLGLALFYGLHESIKLILIPVFASAVPILVLARRRCRSFWRLLMVPLLLTAAILPSLFYDISDAKMEDACGKTVYVSAVIHEVTYESENFRFANGKTVSLGNEKQRVRVKLSYTNGTVTVGDVISGIALITPIDGDDTASTYARSHGFRYEVAFEEAYKTDTEVSVATASFKMRSFLCNLIRNYTKGDGSSLLCAMLLGERDGLSDVFVRDMNRLGLSHTLALSGMHFNILLLGIERLLSLFSVDKRVRYLLLGILTVLYLFAIGGTPSAMRAGLMMLFIIIAFFLHTEYDALTALALSMALICTFTPYAITDLSLLLSVFATLGILLAFGNDYGKKEEAPRLPPLRRALHLLWISVKITLAASLATLPFTAYAYGSLPLLLVFANVLFAPLMQWLLYLSFLTLLLGFLPPVAMTASAFTHLIEWLCARLADIPHTQISMRHPVLFVFLCIGVLLLLLLHIFPPREKEKGRFSALLLAILFLSSGGVFAVRAIISSDTLTVSYSAMRGEQGDAFLLSENGFSAIIDTSRGGSSEAEDIITLLEENYLFEIDAYVVTGYHTAMRATLDTLLTTRTVHRILLPLPTTAEEEALLASVMKSAHEGRSEFSLYAVGSPILLGSAELVLHEHSPLGASVKTVLFTLSCGGDSLAYLSPSLVTYSNWQNVIGTVEDHGTVLFGTYGSGNITEYRPDADPLTDKRLLAVSKEHLPFYDTDVFILDTKHIIKMKKK